MAGSVQAAIEKLKATAERSMKDHLRPGSRDAWLHNGGTALLLFCTTFAALVPTSMDISSFWFWTPRVLAGIAGFWVAYDRSLSFGARWKFHLGMEKAYETVRDQLDLLLAKPPEEHVKEFPKLEKEYQRLRSLEDGLPGISVPRPGGGAHAKKTE